MSERPKPTRTQLRAMAQHVTYEFWMLDRVARALALGLCGDGPLNNALLESFVMHARVLLEFLFPENPRNDDLVASDYFDSPEDWEKARGKLPPELVRVRKRVGKEVAHLTLARLTVKLEEKPWDFAAIAAVFGALMEKFGKAVNPDLFAE